MLQILGWVSRLMRYYKGAGVPIGEIAIPSAPIFESSRQVEIARASSNRNFTVGQIVEAIIAAIKSIEVTYEITLTKQKLSKKEHRKAQLLQEGQKVKVEILELKEDGSIKKVKCIE
jgi:polyribonucleotide nucleotidyltransferase